MSPENAAGAGFGIDDRRHRSAVWSLMRGGNVRAPCQIAGATSVRIVWRDTAFAPSDLHHIVFQTAARPERMPEDRRS